MHKILELLQSHQFLCHGKQLVVELVHHLAGEQNHVLAGGKAYFAPLDGHKHFETDVAGVDVVFETTVEHGKVCNVQGFAHHVSGGFRHNERKRRFDVKQFPLLVYVKTQIDGEVFAHGGSVYRACFVVAGVLPFHIVQLRAKGGIHLLCVICNNHVAVENFSHKFSPCSYILPHAAFFCNGRTKFFVAQKGDLFVCCEKLRFGV